MTQRDELDRMLDTWIDEPYAAPTSRILGRVLEQTRHTRQRPAWASLERWLPLSIVTRPALAPPLRAAWLLLLILLLMAMAAGGAIVGSRLLVPTGPDTLFRGAAIPQGGSAVLAFDSDGDIFTVRADGTDLRRLTSGSDVESSPSWSPDGTRLAYSARPATGVVILDADGSRTSLATTVESGQPCQGDWPATWSPDGAWLTVTVSALCTNQFDVVIVAADGGTPPARLVAPGIESAGASWSPDGTAIAFQGRDVAMGTTGLYVIDLAGRDPGQGGFEARRIADGTGPNLADAWAPPQWSRDGTELVSVVGTTDACAGEDPLQTWDVVAVKADGSGQRDLAAGPLDEYNATWSPDGKQIAFHRAVEPAEYWNDRPCTVRTWIVDADGTNERVLEPLENNWPPPAWSPDGTRLVGGLIDPPAAPGESNPFHLTIFALDGSSEPVTLGHAGLVSWQPFVAPVPPASPVP